MKTLRACLFLMVLTPAWATDGGVPSIELLLYLAEWEGDEQGQAIDPMDLLDAAAVEDGDDEQEAVRRPVVPERSQ